MLQFLLIIAAIAIMLYYCGVKPMKYWKERGVKQTSKVWIAGDNWRVLLKLESFAEMVERVYKAIPGVRYLGAYQFTLPTLILKDPDLIKQICIRDFDHFVDHRSFVTEESDPLFGKNLFSLKGQRWRTMRPILSPSFTSSKMKVMFMLMSECAESLSGYFLKKEQEILDVDMEDIFTRFANDVIATTAFGIKTDSLEDQTNEFYVMGRAVLNFGSLRQRIKFFGYFFVPKLYSYFKIGLFDKHLVSFFTQLIEENIKMRREKGIVRSDMINLLMEAQNGIQKKEEVDDNGFASIDENDLSSIEKPALKELTNLDIAAQAMIFFFAGFDSVSSVMSFMAYELAVNIVIQNRLRKEIEDTLEECEGIITYEALLKMKYMDMVVSETLRKWPSAIAIDRVCTKPYTIEPTSSDEKPVHLEQGTVIWLPIYAIHRDPAIYPEPERFDPERFSAENRGYINPYSYIPFGVGPRNCIGNRFASLEIKIVFFHLLTKFEIVPTKKTIIPIQISKKQFNLHGEGGFNLGLKRLVK